jgi:hypothetical protein
MSGCHIIVLCYWAILWLYYNFHMGRCNAEMTFYWLEGWVRAGLLLGWVVYCWLG